MFILFAVLFFGMAFLSGCATQTLVKVDLMVACDEGLDAKLLSEPCDGSALLADGSTFQVGLDGKRKGDAALSQCSLKVSKLQQAMAACHAAVVNHNAVISGLNKK
jgi:hypothetical protein